jgi:uncharacterized membrane protein
MAIDVFKEYLEEYSGSIMITAGIVLLVVGLMSYNTFGSLLSAASLFFGIIFVSFGFLARLGFFYLRLRSLNGLGTILVCLSVVFFALSVTFIEFQAVKGIRTVPNFIRGFIYGYSVIVTTYRPYVWLGLTTIWISLAAFLAGLIVKVYCALK